MPEGPIQVLNHATIPRNLINFVNFFVGEIQTGFGLLYFKSARLGQEPARGVHPGDLAEAVGSQRPGARRRHLPHHEHNHERKEGLEGARPDPFHQESDRTRPKRQSRAEGTKRLEAALQKTSMEIWTPGGVHGDPDSVPEVLRTLLEVDRPSLPRRNQQQQGRLRRRGGVLRQ